jgi:hypothetical protein
LQLAGDSQCIVCKHCSEAPGLVLIVQQDDGNYAKITFARVALCDFALQILHEAIRKVILSALAAGIFLIAVAAVGTMKFYGVQLRIAVQGCPAGAAHPDCFGIMPFHGKPPVTAKRPPVNWIHVLRKQDAAESQNVTKILYYAEKTVLLAHPKG